MKINQCLYDGKKWNGQPGNNGFDAQNAQLVLAFGESELIADPHLFSQIKEAFPHAHILAASTAGEIAGEEVSDRDIVMTAVSFEDTSIRCKAVNIKEYKDSFETGAYLMDQLLEDNLQIVFVISDGTMVNGSELVAGFNKNNPRLVPVTGGMAGDGPRFKKTTVGLDQIPEQGMVAAIGFYGNKLKVGHGSFGGWDEFGPEKIITRSKKNILYEIDGKNALDLYKEYLGPYSEELPGSALLFPLSLREPGSETRLVRTILGINEEDKSLVFAGNLPQGCAVRLMKANFDRLIEGASIAANNCFTGFPDGAPQLAVLISCVGRKLVLQDRTDEEIAAAKKIFGAKTAIAGFYSYGEISPFNPSTRCELHNQTMTITTFSEL